MEELAEKEKLRNYQNRVSDWIGSQGILFQLKYARTIGVNSIMKQLGSLCTKLIIVFALLAGVTYLLLGRYFEGEAYAEKMSKQLQDSLGASETDGKGFLRSRGAAGFKKVTLKGGEDSFFYQLEMTGLSAPLTYLVGLTKNWAPKKVSVEQVELNLKGGGSREEMERAFASILESCEKDGLNSITVEDFSCDWGYSKLTYGCLSNAEMQADLENGKWIITLSGGTFQQNWLRDLDVKKGELVLDQSGLEFVSLSLTQGQGSLELTGRIGAPIEKPKFALEGHFEDLSVDRFLKVSGVTVRDFLEGHITGDLQISGSTNSVIKVEGKASVAEDLSLTIRERWPVLKAVSIMDTQRTFRRVNFEEGSFEFTTEGGGLQVRNLDLKSGDLARLVGEFTTRLPSQAEAAEFLEITLTEGFSSDSTDTSVAQRLIDERMSLRDAYKQSEEAEHFTIDRSRYDGMNELLVQSSEEDLEGIRLLGEMKVHRVNGILKLAIPESSFAEHEMLDKLYPADQEGWRWIEIEMKDQQFSEISEEANEKILSEARMRK